MKRYFVLNSPNIVLNFVKWSKNWLDGIFLRQRNFGKNKGGSAKIPRLKDPMTPRRTLFAKDKGKFGQQIN
jgi:hypothetical protein